MVGWQVGAGVVGDMEAMVRLVRFVREIVFALIPFTCRVIVFLLYYNAFDSRVIVFVVYYNAFNNRVMVYYKYVGSEGR